MAGKGKGRGPSGRGKPSGKAKGSPARKAGGAGRKPLWLVVFGAVLVAIFVIFAVAQGIGADSVPAGEAAVVKGVSDGSVSETQLKRGTGQQIAGAISESKYKKAPKAGSKAYVEAQEAALSELLEQIWISAAGAELGISVTPKQIATELKTIKKTNFPTKTSYEEFLKKSHFNQQDVNDRVELQILSTEIQEQVKQQAPPVTKGDIQDYYNAELKTQFTEPATRDVRVIVNEDKSKVEAAKKEIEAGKQSEAAWKAAAKKYSSDPTTKTQGGVQKGITEEFVKGELKKAIFDAATGELSDVVQYEKNYLLIEPTAIHASKKKKLAEVKSQISETLTQKAQSEYLEEFIGNFNTKWVARTTCATDVATESCSNFSSAARLAKTRETYKTCYEEEPVKAPKECPAPVTQNAPAIPGTVTKANPKGERKVQLPRPAGLKEAEGEGALPEAVSPESEAATGAEPAE